VVVGERDAPVVKADESIPAPKGRGSRTPKHFPLQIGSFLGAATGAMMAIADPSGRHPFAASDAVVVGEGHVPVVQYFSWPPEPDESIPDPKGRESRTPGLFPC
jgi:hypothetical protein